MIIGYYTYFTQSMQSILSEFNVSDVYSNQFATTFNFSSIIGMIVGSVIASKYKKLKLIVLYSTVGLTVSFLTLSLLFIFSLEPQSHLLLYNSIYAIHGMFICPCYLIGIDLALEISYPVDESIISGILYASSQLYAFIVTLILSVVLKLINPIFILLFIFLSLVLSSYSIYRTEEKMKRCKIDKLLEVKDKKGS